MSEALIERARALEQLKRALERAPVVALADLALERLFVVYPGTRRLELDDRITAVPLAGLLTEAEAL